MHLRPPYGRFSRSGHSIAMQTANNITGPDERKEPKVSDAAHCTNVRYHESYQKPSTSTWVLDGVFGSANRSGLSLFQKGVFLEGNKSDAKTKFFSLL